MTTFPIFDQSQIDIVLNYPKSVPAFDLKGYSTLAVGVEAHDGDTCKIVFAMPDNPSVFYKWTVRMMGYDAPELKGTTKESAIIVRDILISKVVNKCVYVMCLGPDKYGRLLANIYSVDSSGRVDPESINDYILRTTANLGTYAYSGGTKKTPPPKLKLDNKIDSKSTQINSTQLLN